MDRLGRCAPDSRDLLSPTTKGMNNPWSMLAQTYFTKRYTSIPRYGQKPTSFCQGDFS